MNFKKKKVKISTNFTIENLQIDVTINVISGFQPLHY